MQRTIIGSCSPFLRWGLTLFFLFSFFPASPVVAEERAMEFFSFSQMKIPEQDVFFEDPGNTSILVRPGETDVSDERKRSLPLFASSGEVARDPYQAGEHALGPFPKGRPLGITLSVWLGATGTGTYRTDETRSELSLVFEKLVPEAVYTVWCSRVGMPPNHSIAHIPCGEPGAGTNRFVTHKDGSGTIYIRLPGPLEASTKETATVVALLYHSDTRSAGSLEGQIGKTGHQQLVWFLPVQEVLAVQKSEPETRIAQWLFYAGFGSAVLLGLWWVGRRPLTGSSA